MPRKDITMTSEEIQAFLESSHTLQVATNGHDGRPHLAPMWFVMEDDRVVFRSFSKSQKIVNLRRDQNLTVLAERGLAYAELQGVRIRGTAGLVDDPEYVRGLYGRLAAKYPMVGDAPVTLEPAALEEIFGGHATKNTAVIVEPEKITSWDHTKLGGVY